jgi:hypothetical protein
MVMLLKIQIIAEQSIALTIASRGTLRLKVGSAPLKLNVGGHLRAQSRIST